MAESYTVWLGLYDYVPVALSSWGFFVLGRAFWRSRPRIGQMVLLGWLLITVGGAAKATWKLVLGLTAGAVDVRWLDNSLFIFLTAGFVFAAAGSTAIARDRPGRWAPAVTVSLVVYALASIAAVLAGGRTWFFILLAVAAAANTVAAWELARHARGRGLPGAAVLFLVNMAVVLVLPGLARIPDQTVALQWLEQSVNLIAQLAFLVAALSLAGSYAGNEARHRPAVHGGA